MAEKDCGGSKKEPCWRFMNDYATCNRAQLFLCPFASLHCRNRAVRPVAGCDRISQLKLKLPVVCEHASSRNRLDVSMLAWSGSGIR